MAVKELSAIALGNAPAKADTVIGVQSGPINVQSTLAQIAETVINTSVGLSDGDIVVDYKNGYLQYVENNGAFSITASEEDGTCALLIENGASAGTVTFVGFDGLSGDTIDTVNQHKFFLSVQTINGVSACNVVSGGS